MSSSVVHVSAASSVAVDNVMGESKDLGNIERFSGRDFPIWKFQLHAARKGRRI